MIQSGTFPTLTGLPGLFVAVEIGVTVPEPRSAAYAVFPFGVTVMNCGLPPTLIGLPGVLVAVEIGVTTPGVLALATYNVFPSGVIAAP